MASNLRESLNRIVVVGKSMKRGLAGKLDSQVIFHGVGNGFCLMTALMTEVKGNATNIFGKLLILF